MQNYTFKTDGSDAARVWERSAPALLYRGINLFSDDPDAEIIDFANREIDNTRPHILIERSDSANVLHRQKLKHPNCLAVIKQTLPADRAELNEPVYGGRLHVCRIDGKYEAAEQINLDAADLAKLHLGPCFLHRLDPATITAAATVDPYDITSRPIDVFFAGTTEYGQDAKDPKHRAGDVITAHRLKACNIISALGDTMSVTVRTGRDFPRDEYISLLRQSKIVVSPYGWGESCYREYEALLAGAFVVKPYCDLETSEPNIYNSPNILHCAADLSNLAASIGLARSLILNHHSAVSAETVRIIAALMAAYHAAPDIIAQTLDKINRLKGAGK